MSKLIRTIRVAEVTKTTLTALVFMAMMVASGHLDPTETILPTESTLESRDSKRNDDQSANEVPTESTEIAIRFIDDLDRHITVSLNRKTGAVARVDEDYG